MRSKSRDNILEAALELFAGESFHGTSVSKIANAAGVSKGLMYNYFPSKESLLDTLLDEMTDKMLRRFEIPEDGHYTDEQFERFIDTSFEVIQDDVKHAKLFFSLIMQPRVTAVMMEKMMPRVMPYIELLNDYFERRGYPNPPATTRCFSAMIDGLQMHLILDSNFPVDEAREALKKQYLNR